MWTRFSLPRRHSSGKAPWYAFFPGASIFVLVFSLNLVGDGLRDVFDPYRHNR